MADQFVPTAWDVALHPEGVDRNGVFVPNGAFWSVVALHPEGVGRNLGAFAVQEAPMVALHPEGVDRNKNISI